MLAAERRDLLVARLRRDGEAEEAALRRILIRRTADTYVLASIEKLGTVCPYTVTGLSAVAGIITDDRRVAWAPGAAGVP
jgi:DeoR/GlpR family transcriptional regulator of sugar metabolism